MPQRDVTLPNPRPSMDASRALVRAVKDLRWRNGKPVARDWLEAMLADIEQQAVDRGYDRGVNAVRRYNPDPEMEKGKCGQCGRVGYRFEVAGTTLVGHRDQRVRHMFRQEASRG